MKRPVISGVVIHIYPDDLSLAYENLYKLSLRYILICEYFNPTPIEISSWGHSGKLFKRYFAGELLDKYPSLTLVDYGFNYHRCKHGKHDDSTWFLLEKKQ